MVAGHLYPVHTDFRVCLRLVMACEDPQLTEYEKHFLLLSQLFKELPEDHEAGLTAANLFLNGDQEPDNDEPSPLKLYSFKQDSNFIFAAFRQIHGIDLTTASLHWWQFMALFFDLGSETAFSNLVALRREVYSGKATKEQRAAAATLGKTFDIEQPDRRSPEMKRRAAEFMSKLAKGSKR